MASGITMLAIANLGYVYAWNFLIILFTVRLHASFAFMQVAFAVLISTQARALSESQVPERLSPLEAIAIHSVLAGMGWAGAESIPRMKFMTRCVTEPNVIFGDHDLYGRLILSQKPPQSIAFRSERQSVSECGPQYGNTIRNGLWEEEAWLPKMQLSNSETAPGKSTAA
jgi:hypothetical protein